MSEALLTGGALVVAACSGAGARVDTGSSASGINTLDSGGDDSSAGGFDSGLDGSSGLTEAGGGRIPNDGCKAIDFLFVIDDSVSMENQQAALVGAFAGFMDTIQTTLAADGDYHIMVADTDEWGRCDTANPWMGIDPTSETCNDYIQQTVFEECDRTLGAGVVHPAGQYASNMPCVLQGGHRYIEAGEPDLGAAFGCIAQVGVAGHSSARPMDAMIAALQPGINDTGGCNEGFLRNDALLVITFMSDDPNYDDALTPADWYDAVVQAKLGDPTAIVVMGLTPAWDGCQDGSGPPKGAHWAELLSMFGERGLHGNVCGTAQEYVDFFQTAVSTIDQACNEYVPPG